MHTAGCVSDQVAPKRRNETGTPSVYSRQSTVLPRPNKRNVSQLCTRPILYQSSGKSKYPGSRGRWSRPHQRADVPDYAFSRRPDRKRQSTPRTVCQTCPNTSSSEGTPKWGRCLSEPALTKTTRFDLCTHVCDVSKIEAQLRMQVCSDGVNEPT